LVWYDRLMEETAKKIRKEVVGKTLTYLLAGFGFVAALAWNEAVQALFNEIFDINRSGLFAKFAYAALVTLAVTIVSLRLSRYVGDSRDSHDG